jgi:transcriptional regulator with XRE-family HTH domain
MKLKELRKQSNTTQVELSKYLNIARTTYSSYEQKLSEPDIETLCRIADYYGVSLDYLCEHQTNGLQLPALTESQKQLIETILNLNRDNFGIVYGFTMGIYQKQIRG